MKVLDEKGRLFHKVNIVDLIIVIALVLAIGGVGWKLFAPAVTDVVAPEVDMTSIMRIRGAQAPMLAELERESLVGKALVSGNAYMAATITDVEIEPYIVQVPTADGPIVDAIDPTKRDVLVTVVSKVPKGTPTPSIGNQEVRAGRTFILKTQTFETNVTIDSVIIHD